MTRSRARARSRPAAEQEESGKDAWLTGTRLRWTLFAAVVAVSTGLVWGAFNPAPHTGGDNAGYVTLAYSLLKNGTYTELFDPAQPPHTKYPPVFPALLAALMAVGARTWSALKSVAVLSTVGATALTCLWAQRRLGPAWGAGVAAVFAVSSAVVYYSHWILSDPTFVFFTLLSLWALDDAGGPSVTPRRVAVGVGGAVLAYFTRSAGLPLLVAVLGWLALRRRWRALVASGLAMGVPALLWMLRARGPGTADYSAEFWLVDPYQPALGRVGVPGLLGRAWVNLQGYVGTHIPAGIVGARGTAVAVLGVGLVTLALVGWVRQGRTRWGAAELFLPLYAGLVLLWPAVWSGDRFALPLYPVLFVFAAAALKGVLEGRSRGLASGAGLAAFFVLVLPAGRAWTESVEEARACGAAVRASGPFACYGPRVEAFVESALWAGANLPEGSSVLTRKPRIFFVMSGVPSRTFPFDESSDAHLGLADSLGTRYELLDQWDGQAGRFVVGAVLGRPGAFCSVRAFGADQGTRLLGVLPPEARGEGSAAEAGSVSIVACPPAYVRGAGDAGYSSPSSSIPLLSGLDG